MTDTDTTEGKGGEAVRGSHEYATQILANVTELTRKFKRGELSEDAETVLGAIGDLRALAQAYATLAVADETRRLADAQHTANLIAVLTAENADLFSMLPTRVGQPEMYGSVVGQMLEEVQRSLGIYEEPAA